MSDERTSDHGEYAEIESQLRRLPAPTPRPDLERHLLADAAATRIGHARPRRHARWLLALATAAAVVTVAIGLDRLGRRPAGQTTAPVQPATVQPVAIEQHRASAAGIVATALLDNTSPELILGAAHRSLLHETKPCDILPSTSTY